jgi:Phage major tail protein 2.
MAKITANTYFLLIDPAGGTAYDTVVCLTAHSFSGTTETNDTSSFCGPDSSPGTLSSTITLSGFTELVPGSGKVSTPDIFDLWQDRTNFGWKIGPATPTSGDFVKIGTGYFSGYGENYDEGQAGQFSGTITVTGDITQTVTP